ncbi:MFS transporter [Streptomyces sp. NPDC093228]|uniref:MFS transporter n=1 Tax=Streptomyces sp. NPDC093228 TaxID=3155070 RepID=UPI00342E9F07
MTKPPSYSSADTARLPDAPPSPALPPLVTRQLLLRFLTVTGASASFFLLLSVVPLYTQRTGGSPGLATGALMMATVGGELATPRLVARYGYRVALAAGLGLLGMPALVLTAADGMAWIVAMCLLRGLGFALTVVAGGALTASLIPAERRGEGLALAGIVSGVPSLVGLPLGVWLVSHVGFTPVCVAGGVAALAAVVVVPGLPGRERSAGRDAGVVAGLRNGALGRPTAVFATTAIGAGIIVTFLPVAVPASLSGLVTVALFAQPAMATVARWFAGRYGDRHGPARLVLPGLLASSAGLLVTSVTSSPVAVLAGVARGVRGRFRGGAERDADTDVRQGAGVRVLDGQRAVERRLRRWDGPGRGRLRRGGGAHRLGRVLGRGYGPRLVL